MDFRVLGPFEVLRPGGVVGLGGRKEQALLALLVAHPHQPVSLDRMIDELWGEDPPRTATKTVRSYISRLRRNLGAKDLILSEEGGYRLRVDPQEIDAVRFESLLDRGLAHQAAHSPILAAQDLAAALAMVRGPPYSGLEDHAFAYAEAARLEARRLQALEARIEVDLELGRHRRLISELQQLVDAHPLRESFARFLMLALYRSDRQAEALETFRGLSRRLGEELGIEPTQEVKDLEEAILLQDPSLVALEQPTGPIHNLPAPRDSFVGRQSELAEIGRLLGDYRCVTLTGVGGSGKTRLALEASRAVLNAYPAGARYVELTAIADPAAVVEHVLLAFGEPGSHAIDPAGVLVAILGSKRFLLVFDNCEHLVDTVAELADRLLDECPLLSILTTSREPLDIAGEVVYRVPTLEVPDPDDPPHSVVRTESVRLLTERIRAHQHDFEVDQNNAGAVATVCRSLDGIPLAIELAAARARTMDMTELAAHIEDRLNLLTKGSRTAPPRQRTLRATIEWSHELLTPDAQRVFRRLGAFVGSWSTGAASAVVSDGAPEWETINLIEELMEKSLIERASPHRFSLLETIREFAFERLVLSGEAPAIGRRHRDYYLELAQEQGGLLRGHGQTEAWTLLEAEHDNLRTAIRWSLDNKDPDRALEIVAALGDFWVFRGYWHEAGRWLQRTMSAEGGSALARARAIVGVSITDVIRVNYNAVKALLREAAETFAKLGDEEGAAMVQLLESAGASAAGITTDLAPLEASFRRALENDDQWSAAFAARYLGDEAEDHREAMSLLEQSFNGFTQLGDRWNAAHTLHFMSMTYLAEGMFDEGEAAARRLEELANDLGDAVWSAHAARDLGLAAFWKGDWSKAKRVFAEALIRLHRIGDDACAATLHRGLVVIHLGDGDTDLAAEHLAEAIRFATRLGHTLSNVFNLWLASQLALALDDLESASAFLAVGRRELRGKEHLLYSPLMEQFRSIDEAVLASLGEGAEDRLDRLAEEWTLEEAVERALARCEARIREMKLEDAAPSEKVRVTKTFMFTDIVTSTDLIELIGDDAWGELLEWHDRTLRAAIAFAGGEEVRHTGDGFFACFEDPRTGVECAVAIQRQLNEHRRESGFAPKVRIGLHLAEASRRGDDYAGKGVHAAARVAALAEGEEILVSSAVADALESLSLPLSDPETVSLKGISQPVQVMRIDWSGGALQRR